ncbi:hypothetical protein [Methylobacterium sp. C1]|uniref:hypothetical protein n=1 Tax=Methylobacterium sp. C1 TaxID=1479019 RepID=UPI0013313FFF|nr:hypothetical protein [Methylobacterium sp. C1]
MSNIDGYVTEVHNFISSLSFESPLSVSLNRKIYVGVYKYVHALLLWREALNQAGSAVSADAVLQFDELLSDLASTQVLALGGLYKPARMMMRSSVENMLRVIALEQGFVTSGAKFTFELITLVKASALADANSPVRSDLSSIVDSYSALCVYTHAASEEFLSLRVPMRTISHFDQSEFEDLFSEMKNLAQRYNRLIYRMYHKELARIAPKSQDFILDALPKKLKGFVSAI